MAGIPQPTCLVDASASSVTSSQHVGSTDGSEAIFLTAIVRHTKELSERRVCGDCLTRGAGMADTKTSLERP